MPSPINNQTTGWAGSGVGGKYDVADRLFGHKADYTPTTIAQSSQQDRRYQQGQINQAYDGAGRQKQYQDYFNALKGLYTDQVNQQQGTAARNLKFADARSGMTGGSVAADHGGLLQRDYQGGLLTAADTARNGLTDLQDQDQAEKRSLIAMSNDASNVGQNNSGILQGAQLGLKQAGTNANVQSLGDMFANLGGIYQNSQARKYYQQQSSPYGDTAW